MTDSQETSCAEAVRVGFDSFAASPDCRPMFSHIVTLDPHGAQEAWTKLSTFTPAVELNELPWRLHVALVRALKSSHALRKVKVSHVDLDNGTDHTLGKLRSAGL